MLSNLSFHHLMVSQCFVFSASKENLVKERNESAACDCEGEFESLGGIVVNIKLMIFEIFLNSLVRILKILEFGG